jgi:hypothetical protein
MADVETMRLEIIERAVDLDDDVVKAMYFVMNNPDAVDVDGLDMDMDADDEDADDGS